MEKVRMMQLDSKLLEVRRWRYGWLLILLLLMTLFFTGCQGGNEKETEQIIGYAVHYLDSMDAYFQKGVELQGEGLTLQAEHAYRYALASVSSMGLAIENLIYIKGEGESVDPNQWAELTAIQYASPYPYFFEGLVYSAQGDKDYAATCFEAALINPAFDPEISKPLMALAVLPIEELNVLGQQVRARVEGYSAALEKVQTTHRLFAHTESNFVKELQRNPLNYSDAYLRTAAKAYLKADTLDYNRALAHYQAGLMVNPFEGDNYVGCAVMHFFMGDTESALFYIDEGLFIAPNHEGLVALLDVISLQH